MHDSAAIMAGAADIAIWLRFFSVLFSILFNLLVIWMLVVRDRPVRRIGGALPRLCAVGGTFLGVGILRLPVADLSLPLQALATSSSPASAAPLPCGAVAAGQVLLHRAGGAPAGDVSGPYGWARHPLYAAEIVTVLGLAIQYSQPWAALMGAGVMALQVTRSVFEERVLGEAFPEYANYRKRVKRFGFI